MFKNCASNYYRFVYLVIAVMTTGLLAGTVAADDESLLFEKIVLTNGESFYGTTKTVEENKFTFHVIQLPDGGTLKLRRSQVAHILPPPAEAAEYLKRRSALADTVDAHWDLSEWCASKRLLAQKEYHLMQVVRLKPDHKDAWKRMGFSSRQGVWIHDDHFYQSQGYVKDERGIFRIPAGIRLSENEERAEKAISDATNQIRSIIKQYERRKDASILNQLSAIKDPAAITGLRELLADEFKRQPPSEPFQHLIIETIGGIESYGAQNALIDIAMLPHEFFADGTSNAASQRYAREMREQCVRLLKQPNYDHPAAVSRVLPFLRPKPDTEVYKVRLAAWIVGELGDESANPWIIDGLITTHRQRLIGQGGNMTMSQEPGSTNFNPGGDKPKFVMVPFRNPQALDALKMMSKKQDIGYDQAAWLRWYIATQAVGSPNLNRDE